MQEHEADIKMGSGGEPGLEQIEPFASSFASTPRELVGTAQRMRVFRPDVPDSVSARAAARIGRDRTQ